MSLTPKITRNKSIEIDEKLAAKIAQMSSAGADKFIIDMIALENLSMTAMQAVLTMAGQCLRAKLNLQLVSTPEQAKSLMGFKETSVIPIKLSLDEAKQELRS